MRCDIERDCEGKYCVFVNRSFVDSGVYALDSPDNIYVRFGAAEITEFKMDVCVNDLTEAEWESLGFLLNRFRRYPK